MRTDAVSAQYARTSRALEVQETVTQDTWSIGELAAGTGVAVKTLRYYSDSGLLPVSGRSTGGHRRYGPEAWERIRLIRRLRALDTPIATITQVVTGECSLGELVATELEVVQERLTELRWRQATLKSLDGCTSEERLRRLEILSRVQRLPQAHRTLTDHWYRELSAAMPKRRLDIMVAMLSPAPPQDPDPGSVLAYAELHLLIATPGFTRWTQDHAEEMRDAPAFYGEIDEAAVLTAAALAQGLPPGDGDAVNAFVSAHARARRESDTPAFREHLHGLASRSSGFDPRLERYWALVGTATGGRVLNMTVAHRWLTAGLAISIAGNAPSTSRGPSSKKRTAGHESRGER
ncbi:MerR family transcriptional regulator [Streptomyces sp. NBC_01565]|uniref:MerR family transcriptional regulator n=1 Tax=unclassified Streptomyces TaxID=2593676 RepID=UPI0022528576|nr:MerR family transcriptional regulator [Streptomyces sp. NBC_01565]MCX4546050.1 MerR family transcriptional regulator [Streptomyces sp. NBC_01565]